MHRARHLGLISLGLILQIPQQTLTIVVKNVGVFGNKLCGLALNIHQAADDGRAQVFNFLRRIRRAVIDDGVNIALGMQLRRRDTHVLCAFLPREI